MFIGNISGKETITAKAAALGCKAGEALQGRTGYGRPGLTGSTFSIKEQLKAAGARWDGANTAWTFESWAALDAALDQVAA